MRNKIRPLVISAMFAALICVATLVIQIPSPLGGYINLGDALIITCAACLSPWYAFFAAAIGSALADVLLSYVAYAPATFIIKGLMALVFCLLYKAMRKKLKDIASAVIGAIASETLMVLGYWGFEGFLYGFGASLVNIPPNAVQGCAGIVLGVLLIQLFKKVKFLK